MAAQFKGLTAIKTVTPKGKTVAFKGLCLVVQNTSQGLPPKFKGLTITTKNLLINAVTITDQIGTLTTFQISNASIYDLAGINSKNLTFQPNTLVADETAFGMKGISNANQLRLSLTLTYEIVTGRPVVESFVLSPSNLS